MTRGKRAAEYFGPVNVKQGGENVKCDVDGAPSEQDVTFTFDNFDHPKAKLAKIEVIDDQTNQVIAKQDIDFSHQFGPELHQ